MAALLLLPCSTVMCQPNPPEDPGGSRAEATCTLCSGGQQADLSLEWENVPCTEYDQNAAFLTEDTTACWLIQAVGFKGCGCPEPPGDFVGLCTLCPNGSVFFDQDKEIPPEYLGGQRLTCGDLAWAAICKQAMT